MLEPAIFALITDGAVPKTFHQFRHAVTIDVRHTVVNVSGGTGPITIFEDEVALVRQGSRIGLQMVRCLGRFGKRQQKQHRQE